MLAPVYPNPFHAEATLRFSVNTSQQVYLALYDMLGREVQHLFEGTPPPGTLQTVRIDGATLPSGIYQVRLKGERFITSRQMVLIK